MKLKYIVNANLNGNFARSVQINSNTAEFSNLLKGDFECVAVGDVSSNYKNIWVNEIVQESSILRKILFHFQIIKSIRSSDIVYSRNLSVLWLANFFGKKVVWEIHDAISGSNKKIFGKLERNIKVVSISGALKKYLLETFDIKPENILVAHDGVFMDKYDLIRDRPKKEIREELGLPLNKNIIMHTGSLFLGRGAELFDVVVRNFPDLYFVQVGGKPADIEYWKNHYRTTKNILFFGHQNNDQLIKFQMSADVMFLPMTKASSIWWCTSPMKLFEYMATGNVICSSNIGSLCEVINNKNSIQFDPENEKSIIDAIQVYLKDPTNALKIADQSLDDVRKNYSWKKRISDICDFIL